MTRILIIFNFLFYTVFVHFVILQNLKKKYFLFFLQFADNYSIVYDFKNFKILIFLILNSNEILYFS